jgi:hypothetical protein
VLRKLISFLVKYEIPKNKNVSIGHQAANWWSPGDTTMLEKKKQ